VLSVIYPLGMLRCLNNLPWVNQGEQLFARRLGGITFAAARCGDESALAVLYDESSQLVYTIALRILQDEADASEVVLDVYKQVWDAAARFDEQRGSAAAWIVILARSRAMDRRRSRSSRMRSAATLEELPEVISAEPSPESLAIANQSSRSVLRALAEVPSEQRQALELAFFAGLSHSEIAGRLGEPWGR
jgi:RNA polymerase sigma-70 factor (ECF subfamily)